MPGCEAQPAPLGGSRMLALVRVAPLWTGGVIVGEKKTVANGVPRVSGDRPRSGWKLLTKSRCEPSRRLLSVADSTAMTLKPSLSMLPTARHRAAVDVAAAVLRHVGEAADGQAGVVLAQDEVDDAADGVGAVGRRGAVLQHLDALDRGHRDLVQVDDAAVEAVRRDAAAVQQDQRRVGALQAQVGGGRAVVAAGLARDHVRVGGQVVQAVAVGRERSDQLLGRHDALAVEVAARDGLHRQRALVLDALDARAGDLHPLDLLDFLRPGRRMGAQAHHDEATGELIRFRPSPC